VDPADSESYRTVIVTVTNLQQQEQTVGEIVMN